METPPPSPRFNNLDIWDILGLTGSEKKIMQSLTKMAKTPGLISIHTGIPHTTISHTLKKLTKRGLVRTISQPFKKRNHWKSNLPRVIRYIRSLPFEKQGLY